MTSLESILKNDTSVSPGFLNYTLSGSLESPEKPTVGAENIYPALIECFGIISLGYLAGR